MRLAVKEVEQERRDIFAAHTDRFGAARPAASTRSCSARSISSAGAMGLASTSPYPSVPSRRLARSTSAACAGVSTRQSTGWPESAR